MTLTTLDFARRPAAATGWRLALLAGGLLALTAAGADWIVQARGADALERQLAQVQPRAPRSIALAGPQLLAQQQQLKAIGAAVRELNLPVTRLVKTVQAPPDIRVALLGLDLGGPAPADTPASGAAGALKIGAEAETAQDMINYVAYLNEQPLFTSVYLVKHEMRDAAPGRPYRFQLEARWQE